LRRERHPSILRMPWPTPNARCSVGVGVRRGQEPLARDGLAAPARNGAEDLADRAEANPLVEIVRAEASTRCTGFGGL
jgi:hypothetical protein